MSSQDQASSPSSFEQLSNLTGTVASYLRLPFYITTGLTAIGVSMLYFKQKALVYPSFLPSGTRTDVSRPSQFGLNDFEDLMISTPDGEKLSAFYIRAPSKHGVRRKTTVLMFHGNAGNIGHRVPIAKMLIHSTGCNVFMCEYRGYGLSTGSPDETGLKIDGQTALNYLRAGPETMDHDIVVYGQSLGGGVAINLVANNQKDAKIIGLVLENTFLSMRKMVPAVLPAMRYVSFLCHQVWPSETTLPTITEIPVLFLSGLMDEIVPPAHMRRLFELCQSGTKIWKPFPSGDHNSCCVEPGYFDAIAEFVSNLDTKSK